MKNINYSKILILLVVSGALFLSSCRDFLDIKEYRQDMLEYDSIFSSAYNLDAYLWGAAALLPDEANIWGSSSASGTNLFPGVSASDEAINQWNNTAQPGTMLALGGINADNIADSYSGHSLNFWKNMYQIVRKVNLIVSNIDKTKDLSTTKKNQVLGYSYFLRAYAYYHILMNQGPFIIVGDDVYEVNREAGYYDNQRATYDECVEYICDEFEKAARFMPDAKPQISQFGRPTPGAARALIARVRLYHASPLFNGPVARKYFSDWKRSSDKVNYVKQAATGEVDENRWALAAWAAERIINSGDYELFTVPADTAKLIGGVINSQYTPPLPAAIKNRANYPNGPNGIDHFKSYSIMFNGEGVPYQNKEFIWARWSTTVREYTRHSFSVAKGGYGGMAIPQKIIDNYRRNDGTQFLRTELDVSKLAKDSIWSGYKLGGNRVNNFFVKREARFYASIGFQFCYWPMSSNTTMTEEAAKYIDYTKNGADGQGNAVNNKTDYSLTGYVSKKYIHPDDAWTGTGNKRTNKSFPIIRYAETLLSYAEAMNNLQPGKTYNIKVNNKGTVEEVSITRDNDKMLRCFNLVRYRAGLPGLDVVPSRQEMFDLIVQERMVEFLHENQRYYDVRRWGIYEDVEKMPIEGMDVQVSSGDGFYNIVRIDNAVVRNRIPNVHPRMLFLPLSTGELRKVPGLDQNWGW